MEENKNIGGDDGDSQIYAGFGYIGIILNKIRLIDLASDNAYEGKGLTCLKWLNQMRGLYPLVRNQMDIKDSNEEVDFSEIVISNDRIEKKLKKVKKSQKYPMWFDQIEDMIERNSQVSIVPATNPFKQLNYINDKKILSELSACQTELLMDANSRHILMPEGRKDMKDLVKKEWIDRAKKKEF